MSIMPTGVPFWAVALDDQSRKPLERHIDDAYADGRVDQYIEKVQRAGIRLAGIRHYTRDLQSATPSISHSPRCSSHE